MKVYYIISLILIPYLGNATLITHTDYTNGGAITATGQNTNENAAVSVLNGKLDYTNFVSTLTAACFSNLSGNRIAGNTISGSTANSGGSAGVINQGTVSYSDLTSNATNNPSYNNAFGTTCGVGSLGTAQTVSITTLGNPVLVSVSMTVSGTSLATGFKIFRDAATPLSSEGGEQGITINKTSTTSAMQTTFIDIVSAGTHTYDLDVCKPSGTSVLSSSLIVIELR